jgi:hypothetical protein
MSRSTLALAYAARTAKAPEATASAKAPSAHMSVQAPTARQLPHPSATVRATLTAPGPAPYRSAPSQPQETTGEDALLIAVRRSLASCRDSAQRRMLPAFEAKR